MPDDTRVSVVSRQGRLLSQGNMHVCAVQLRPTPADVISEDGARDETLGVLGHLLGTQLGHAARRLGELVGDHSPVIVVFPEYAFSGGDLQRVRDMLLAYERDLVLVGGFGATTAATINAWGTNDEQINVIRSWPDDQELPPDTRYNGGWIWIKVGAEKLACVVFLKNHAEQRQEETLIPQLRTGTHILRLEFDDLVMFPLVCADLICTSAGNDDPLSRVRRSLDENTPRQDQRIAVVGLLREANPSNTLWTRTVHRAASLSQLAQVTLLVNWALESATYDPTRDEWRTLTGVYVDRGAGAKSDLNEAALIVQDEHVHGCVLRHTSPCVVGGRIRWDYRGGQGGSPWRPLCVLPIDGGALGPAYLHCATAFELDRLIALHLRSEEERISVDLSSQLKNVVEAHNLRNADSGLQFVRLMLDGVRKAEVNSADVPPRGPFQHPEALWRGTRALAAVCLAANATPSIESDISAHARLDEPTRLLVWVETEAHAQAVQREIQDWLLEPTPHCPIVIALWTREGEFEGVVTVDSRTDITASRDAESRDFTQAEVTRHAYVVRIASLENCYATAHANVDRDGIRQLVLAGAPPDEVRPDA